MHYGCPVTHFGTAPLLRAVMVAALSMEVQMSDVVQSHYVERHSVMSTFFILVIIVSAFLTLLLAWVSLKVGLEQSIFLGIPGYIMTALLLYTSIMIFGRTKPSPIVVIMSKEALRIIQHGKDVTIPWNNVLSVKEVDFLFGRPAQSSGVIVSYKVNKPYNASILIRDPFQIHRSEFASEIRKFRRDAASDG
jgi:hypothetical protein